MPHQRQRFLKPVIFSALKWSPVVGVYGLRQAGKTTLVKEITEGFKGEFETLDREILLQTAKERPLQFLSRHALLTIDEAQKAPQLFPAIKELVGTKRKPGLFLLTGSIRFTLKKDIQESLTGRMILRELLPFSLAEAHQLKQSVFLKEVFKVIVQLHSINLAGTHSLFNNFIKRQRQTAPNLLSDHLIHGGLPIPCFARDPLKRKMWFEAYFETMLSRDIVMVDASLASLSIRQKLSFLRELALVQGNEVNLSDLAAKSSLSPLLSKRLLRALEILTVLDRIPPHLSSKKSIKKLQIEWKDSGLWGFLVGLQKEDSLLNIKAIGLLLTQEFRSQLSEFEDPVFWNFYRSREGACIPWIFKKGDYALAVKFYPSEIPSPYDWRILKKFVQTNKKSLGLLIGPQKATPTILDDRIWFVPLTFVF